MLRSSSLDLNLDLEQISRREAEKQENLMDELFGMARLMKQTYSTAGAVIKEDNAVCFLEFCFTNMIKRIFDREII